MGLEVVRKAFKAGEIKVGTAGADAMVNLRVGEKALILEAFRAFTRQ